MNALPRIATRTQYLPRSVRLTLTVDPADPVFDGHFPGRPVLPGVAQIDWAMRFARSQLDCDRPFSGTRVIKFLQVIRPPATLALDLDWRAAEATLDFRYFAPTTGTTYSRGTLCFE